MRKANPLHTFKTPSSWLTGECLEVYSNRLLYYRHRNFFQCSFEEIEIDKIGRVGFSDGLSRIFGIGSLTIHTEKSEPFTIEQLRFASVAREFIQSLRAGQDYDVQKMADNAKMSRRLSLLIVSVITCSICIAFASLFIGLVNGTLFPEVSSSIAVATPAATSTKDTATSTPTMQVTRSRSQTASVDSIPTFTSTPTPTITPIPTTIVTHMPMPTNTATPMATAASKNTEPTLSNSWECGREFSGSQWGYYELFAIDTLGMTFKQFGALVEEYNPHMFERRGSREKGIFYADETYCLPL